MSKTFVIVDYGMGNIASVEGALRYLGVMPEVTDEPARVARADTIVLPGVGSFNTAMTRLDAGGLTEAIREAVLVRQRKVLGICLGMQLMAEIGTEDGRTDGLGFFSGSVEHFRTDGISDLKIPHVGFNLVAPGASSRLFAGLYGGADFYFVHTYRLMQEARPGVVSLCRHGVDFVAAYEHENVFCTQFHPEKSQTNGLKLLSNFLSV